MVNKIIQFIDDIQKRSLKDYMWQDPFWPKISVKFNLIVMIIIINKHYTCTHDLA